MGTYAFTSVGTNTELIGLPFDRPLADWPDELIVYVPRGISRHLVRFVEVDGQAKYDQPGEWQREKERQNKLVAMGYIVLRFTWRDVVGRSEYVLACVRRAVG